MLCNIVTSAPASELPTKLLGANEALASARAALAAAAAAAAYMRPLAPDASRAGAGDFRGRGLSVRQARDAGARPTSQYCIQVAACCRWVVKKRTPVSALLPRAHTRACFSAPVPAPRPRAHTRPSGYTIGQLLGGGFSVPEVNEAAGADELHALRAGGVG